MASETHAPQHTHTGKFNAHNLIHTAQKDLTPLQGFLTKFGNDWSMMFAGSLAFSLLTAIIPILLAILSVLGFILGPGSVDYVRQHIKLGSDAALNQAIGLQLKTVITQLNKEAGIIALIAIVTAIFGGSRLFLGLEGCLDIVYRVRPRKIIAQNVMAISMMVVFIILVPIMIFAATLPGIVQSFFATNSVVQGVPIINFITNNPVTVYLVGFIGGLIAAFLLFWAIYVVVPNQKISLKRSWQGAIVAAFALELFITIVFPFYATHFLGNYAGQAGLAIILLIFFYYFAVILMLGAEVNAYFFEKVQPLPNDLATFVSTMAGKLNKDRPPEEGSSHIDPKPTNRADHKHIVEARIPEEENDQEQKEAAQTKVSQDAMKKQPVQKKRSNGPSKAQTALSVVFGSALAMIIELRRQRQH
jgi:YihY family inner membrane protein